MRTKETVAENVKSYWNHQGFYPLYSLSLDILFDIQKHLTSLPFL